MTATQENRNARRVLEGTVTSDKMAKTITVEVERTYKHAKYGKFVRKAKKYHAHDEASEARVGDRVEIATCRPYSKTKRFRLVRVVEKSRLVDATDYSIEADAASRKAAADAAEAELAKKEAAKNLAAKKGGVS